VPGRRRVFGRALLGVAAVTLLAGCGRVPGQGGVQPTVKVALVDVFSGAAEASGRDARNGLQLAVDGLNAQGGLLGDRVEVVPVDGEANPAKVTELLRQQLSDDGVRLVVGPSPTAAFQATRAAIGQAAVPNCLPSVTDDALNGAPSSFRVSASDRTRVAALLAYVRQSRTDVRKVGLLAGDDNAQGYDRLVADEAGRAGLTYAGRAGAPDADPAAALQQLAGQGVQAVVLAAQPAYAIRAAQAVRQLGLGGKLLLLGFDALASYDFPDVGGDPALSALLVATNRAYLTASPDTTWPPAYRAFVGTAAREYGTATNGVELQADPVAADCVLAWSRAVRRAGTFRGPDVTRAWEGLYLSSSDTALGVTERPTAADHTAVGPDGVFVYTWSRDGARFRLKQLAGPALG
jgi:branched-chain amino acid transport system substrate-binding protein